jgi:ribosomal protein S27E
MDIIQPLIPILSPFLVVKCTDCHGLMVSISALCFEILCFSLGPATNYCGWGVLWFSSDSGRGVVIGHDHFFPYIPSTHHSQS